MLTLVIHSQDGLASMNIRIDENASKDDLRDAWNNTANGTLLMHLRETLRLECITREIDPNSVLIDP